MDKKLFKRLVKESVIEELAKIKEAQIEVDTRLQEDYKISPKHSFKQTPDGGIMLLGRKGKVIMNRKELSDFLKGLKKLKLGEDTEGIEEAPRSAGHGIPSKSDWNYIDSRLASEVNKIFKAANIRVMKHTPYKHGNRGGDSAMYGAFIDTKDKDGSKVTLPIEVDNKGIVRYAGGPSGWHKMEKIGVVNIKQGKDTLKLKTLAQSKAFMKHFAKLPGFGQSSIGKKR